MKTIFKSILILMSCCFLISACTTSPKEPPFGYELATFPTHDEKIKINTYVLRAFSPNKPVVVILAGSNGIWNPRDKSSFTPLIIRWSSMLNNRDWNVLILDSVTPRSIRGNAAIASRQLNDILGAIDWIKTQSDMNSQKIALLGFSVGATAVLGAIDTSRGKSSPNIIGGVSNYPVAGPFIGKPEKKGGWTGPVSSNYNIDKPLLLTVGEDDNLVSPLDVQTLANNLQAKGAPITFKLYPETGHGYGIRKQNSLRLAGGRKVNYVSGAKNPEVSQQTQEDIFGFFYDLLEGKN